MLRTAIQLTVEDIEALLDAMGPATEDSPNLAQVRVKLEQALNLMRGNKNLA